MAECLTLPATFNKTYVQTLANRKSEAVWQIEPSYVLNLNL